MKIVSVDQMRRLEQAAFASGTPEDVLQDRAGAAVAEEIQRLPSRTGRIVVLVGRGNNGRDGYVAARYLARQGRLVTLVLGAGHAVTPSELETLQGLGGILHPTDDFADLSTVLNDADIVVDGLVGIGARGALRQPYASAAETLNRARDRLPRLAVVAIDVPSGVDPDSGAVPGTAVHATHTVTLGAVKSGLLLFPAASYVGCLIPRSIGVPSDADSSLPFSVLERSRLPVLLPRRPLDANKYSFGRILVVAGSDHFPGAALLCSSAAARSGAGLTTLAVTRDVRLLAAAHHPEITYTTSDVATTDGAAAAEHLAEYVEAASAVVIGPGLGRAPGTIDFVHALVRVWSQRGRSAATLVLDADALFALSEQPAWWRALDHRAVLTPHAGELRRLCADPDADLAGPPWEAASRLAQRWGCTLVYKGPTTSIGAPDGTVSVWCWPNSALATGGTGDVLAGLIGGFAAQSLPPIQAAQVGVMVHAAAADVVQRQRGWSTLLAGDLPDAIPTVVAEAHQT